MSKKTKAKKKEQRVVVVEAPAAPMVLPPRLYKPLEDVCRAALDYGGNAAGVRDPVRKLAFAMRAIAEEEVGHLTTDITMLESLLKRTDPRQAELPLGKTRPKDPVEVLFKQRHLNSDQRAAALFVRDVWNAWGRYLVVSGHGFDGEGGGTRRLRDPFEAMGQDLWDRWKTIYKPWYELVKREYAPRKSGGMVPVSKLVLSIIIEPVFPGALDDLERLERGTCLRVLKEQLTALSKLREGAQNNG